MFSRAHLLIERDYERLLSSDLWGIEASPIKDDSIFEWSAKIFGLKGTVWEGGIFRLYLKFDENYNGRPPDVCFHTIPFHPNVDMITGKPCIEFLDDWTCWQEKFSMTTILLTIQMMLANPTLDNAVNPDAVDMVINSPHSYKQMVLDCVAASQRVEAGLHPHFDGDNRIRFTDGTTNNITKAAITKEILPPRKAVKMSFEDYHQTWSGIATSNPNADMKNPVLTKSKELQSSTATQAGHYGLPAEELQAQKTKQLEEHKYLIYGKFNNKPKLTEEELRQEKMEKVQQMRKIYLAPRTPKTPAPPMGMTNEMVRQIEAERHKGEEHWEEEVDDLVAWTSNLNAELL